MKVERKVNKVVLHHAAHTFTKRQLSKPKWIISQIGEWHKRRGFSEIGYHFLIISGRSYSCRDLDKQGAHCKGENKDSIGICIADNLETRGPKLQDIEALKKTMLYLNSIYDKTLPLYPHYAFRATVCPGPYTMKYATDKGILTVEG